MTSAEYSLSAAERKRIAHVDELVARGDSVEPLLAMLSDPSWTVRRAVVAALAALGDAAVPALCNRLVNVRSAEHTIAATVDALVSSIGVTTDRQVMALVSHAAPPVLEDVARILGRRRATAAVPVLSRLLAHEDDNVALAAIESLGLVGGAASVHALVEVVRSRNFFRTFPAMHVAAATSDPRVIAPVAELLDDEMYRLEASRALGRTGSAAAVAPLAALLAPPADPSLVRVVAAALSDLLTRAAWAGSFGPTATTMRDKLAPLAAQFSAALVGGDRDEQLALVGLLGVIGDAHHLDVLAPLLSMPELREAASAAVDGLLRADRGALTSAFSHADPAVRAAAALAARGARASSRVRALLADEDAHVRARACEALARLGDTAAVRALFGLLDDPSPRVAHAAMSAIHSLGSKETPQLAIAALGSASVNVRRHALRVIAYLGVVEAFAAVRATIDDPDPRIGELAVAALGAMDHPLIDALLADVARSPVETLRASAMRAAGLRGGEAMIALLARGLDDDSSWVRYYASQGLGRQHHDASTSALIGRLADSTPLVRVAAIEALAQLSTPAAWQALRSAAASSDVDARRAALIGIGHAAQPAAVALLLEHATSPDRATRLVALSGLGHSKDPRALGALVAATTSAIPEVRDAALSLLGERTDRAAADALVELALAASPEHPAHATLSLASEVRIAAIAARLVTADALAAPVLVAALARMHDVAATQALFAALGSPSPATRRFAASALVAIAADDARIAVRRLATSDPDPEVRLVCAAAVAE